MKHRFFNSHVLLGVLAGTVLSVAGNAQFLPSKVMWHDATTGKVSLWNVGFDGYVSGDQFFSWKCDTASRCAQTWKIVGQIGGNPLWYNVTTGEVSRWLADSAGTVTGTQSLSWRCDAASGCANTWKIIGTDERNYYGNPKLWWHNESTGEISLWFVNGAGTVTGAQSLDWRCNALIGCGKPIGTGDFDYDGNTDLLWYDANTGEVSIWLLSGLKVIGTQSLPWKCDLASGCAQTWKIIGTGDFNGDGKSDVLWFNPASGELSAWLLNGAGNITGTQSLSWRCPSACSQEWKPVAIVAGGQDIR
jgi:hypothetical protein